jgi:HD superfamily phosphohydrolase
MLDYQNGYIRHLFQAHKHKIINDPVWGFISIASPLVFGLIEHPYFQRLRRIKQLGMTDLVYPGANHTRFAHALGAFHLMTKAVELLREKRVAISDEEEEALYCGILLHDIGHGPFSHSLEFTIVKDIHHERLSLAIMQLLNKELKGALDLTIQIFLDKHPKKFLHQLISSQLDMDRLDYLSRDSFYTGVSEGVIGAERLIHMLNVAEGHLVVEQKGIYSVEKFLIARRLMYWQVYLHKTVVVGDCMLQQIFKRTAHLLKKGEMDASLALHPFLMSSFKDEKSMLQQFLKLDDADVYAVIKQGVDHNDRVLSTLCEHFTNRKFWEISLSKKKFTETEKKQVHSSIQNASGFTKAELSYFVKEGKLENNAYLQKGEHITILQKNGSLIDVTEASDNYNLNALKKKVVKYYITWSK